MIGGSTKEIKEDFVKQFKMGYEHAKNELRRARAEGMDIVIV